MSKHNLRLFQSEEYNEEMIEVEVGSEVNILDDVKEIVPEFKIASAVTHLDEDSPHMHVVGVPVATGYKRGLSKQVAKTKVFDQKRLETIQDQMHDFVEHQMKVHPEIFGDETLKPKEKGRNSDFSKEFYLRLKQQEYEKLEDKCREKETQIEALDGRRTSKAQLTNVWTQW